MQRRATPESEERLGDPEAPSEAETEMEGIVVTAEREDKADFSGTNEEFVVVEEGEMTEQEMESLSIRRPGGSTVNVGLPGSLGAGQQPRKFHRATSERSALVSHVQKLGTEHGDRSIFARSRMWNMWKLILAAMSWATLATVVGCAGSPSVAAMSYEECAASRHCTVSGAVSAQPAEYAWMGRLELPDGRCVSVSLPASEIDTLQRDGPRHMTVSGRVYGDPSMDQEVAWLEIEGRRIGLGLCGSFFVFVRA